MRTRAGLLGGALVLLIGAGVAALAYQAGVTQGAASSAGAATYGPWFWGFGGFHILGILFGLFFLFLVARVVIGILFWRGGTWGPGRHGPWARGPWGYADREQYLADLHRRMHEREAAGGAGPAGQPPAGPATGA